jgi:DNA-binding transcriptional LysR family regulator
VPFRTGQLRYFVMVAEEGQMTRAAAKLGIAQPALSQAIAGLEAEVGFQLLERKSRGVSLTPSGEVFLTKARAAVSAAQDARLTAQSLARVADGKITIGHAGLPPWQIYPELAEAVAEGYPDIEVATRELPFPSVPASSWLAEVDVTLVSPITPDPLVWVEPLRDEQRGIILSRSHRLAGRKSLSVADVVDETFVGLDRACDPRWRGFWSLDDARGTPPKLVTMKPSANAQERFGMIAAGHGITVASSSQGAIIERALPGVLAIPLVDAEPVTLSMVGRTDRLNVLVDAFRGVAKGLRDGA